MSTRSGNEDTWFGVEDKRLRKRIQDRLAQRSRRNRLKENRSLAAESRSESIRGNGGKVSESSKAIQAAKEATGDSDHATASALNKRNSRQSHTSTEKGSQELDVVHATDFRTTRNEDNTLTSSPSRTLFPDPNTSVFAALFTNGVLLGMQCSQCRIEKSRITGYTVPSSLIPTLLQLEVPHPMFIDRFPFQKFRDNFIYFALLIDVEQFLSDLFNLPSFALTPGGQSWDPSVWRIGPQFEERWGYLFY